MKLAGGILGITLLANVCKATDEETISDVRCTEIAFSQSIEQRDRDQFLSFLDPDARFVGRSVLTGPEEIVEAWSVFMSGDGPEIIWRPQFTEVLESGDLALSRGPYRLRTLDDEGQIKEQWGTFNSVWRKNEQGRWLIIFDAGNDSAKPLDDVFNDLLAQSSEGCGQK